MKRLTFILCAWMIIAGAQILNAKTYDLKICRYDTTFFENNNDLFMILYTEDLEVTPRLDIQLEEGQRFFTNGKTYTWDDMLHTFCFAYVRDEYREIPFVDATFTWSLDELGLEHFVGSATDSEGNVYNYHYDVLPYIPTGDTIEVAFSQSMKMEHAENNWFFSGTEGNYDVLMTFIQDGDSPVGHYTAENIDLSYSYIDKSLGDGNYEMIYFHHATVDITEGADDTLRIEALIAALDTNVYRFHLYYVAPKALKQVTITATNLYINTDYLYGMVGAFRIEASDADHSVILALSPTTADMNIYDTYSISNQTSNLGNVAENIDPDTRFDVYDGTIFVTKTDKGAAVTGKLLCYNNTEYTLDLSYFVPEKTREEDFIADGMELQVSNQGAWRISGYNADSTQFVALVFNGLGIAGEYSIVEMSPTHCYVVTDIVWTEEGEVDSYTYYEVLNADLTAEMNAANSIVTVTGSVISRYLDDIPQFNVQLSNKPAKHEDVETVGSSNLATKRWENGVLIMEKNDKKYTILGNIIP